MTQMTVFIKKEILEMLRTSKLLILIILFCVVGIMSPAVAKLTPWLMEMMSSDLADSGFVVESVTVNAMSSWTQFYKNVPTAMIVFIIMMGNCFTAEYQRGTLVNMVTKGLNRWKILAAKSVVLTVTWTLGYWLCYGITYGYTVYFWGSDTVQNLVFSASLYWLFGLWLVLLIPLASTIADSFGIVLLCVGAAYLLPTLLGTIPKLAKYMPTRLTDATSLLYKTTAPADYTEALVVTGVLIVLNLLLGVVLFNKKNLA